MRLKDVQVFFFDLDGCLYFTDQPAPGAGDMIETLRRDGKKIGFITNNSRDTGADIAAKLSKMGIRAFPEEVFAATELTGAYVKDRCGIVSVKAVGTESLKRSLGRWGHTVTELDDDSPAEAVVIGRDTEFTFDKLQRIVEWERRGAVIFAANPDAWHPGPGGMRVPETGALAAAAAAITGKPAEYAGKPNDFMYRFAMRQYGAEPRQCVMIGDNLHTDIAGARRAGMHSVWIRGPGPHPSIVGEPPAGAVPDTAVDSIEQLLFCYRGGETI